jgi:hypothetical protein
VLQATDCGQFCVAVTKLARGKHPRRGTLISQLNDSEVCSRCRAGVASRTSASRCRFRPFDFAMKQLTVSRSTQTSRGETPSVQVRQHYRSVEVVAFLRALSRQSAACSDVCRFLGA